MTHVVGELIRLTRRSGFLALNNAKELGYCQNPMKAALLLYTDCPCTAAWLSTTQDIAVYCGVSQIVGVCCVMGENFPPDSFEALRPDLEMPRIAAMFVHAVGTACPRCRKVTEDDTLNDLCARCFTVLGDETSRL